MDSRRFELQLRAIVVPMRVEADRQSGENLTRFFSRAAELLVQLESAARGHADREQLLAEAWRELNELRGSRVEQAVYHIEELVDAERLG